MFLDKTLLSNGLSIGGLFLLVNGYFASKSKGWRWGWEGGWSGGRPFDKSAHLLVESPVEKAFLSTIHAVISCTLQISFADFSNSQSIKPGCIHPEIFGISIEVIVIDFQSKGCMSFKIIGCLSSGRTARWEYHLHRLRIHLLCQIFVTMFFISSRRSRQCLHCQNSGKAMHRG